MDLKISVGLLIFFFCKNVSTEVGVLNVSDVLNTTTILSITEAETYLEEYLPGQKAAQECESYKREFCWRILPYAGKPYDEKRRYVHAGQNAPSQKYRHMAAIGYNNIKSNGSNEKIWLCGGSLISPKFILTAAHCCFSTQWGVAAWARLGDLDLSRDDDDASPMEYKIIQRIKHPNYLKKSFYHDIALIKLEKDVFFTPYIRPACLLHPKEHELESAAIVGWGLINWDDEKTSSFLQEASVNIVNNTHCNTVYSDNNDKLKQGIVSDWQICAGGDGKDTCPGDSGAPLATCNLKEFCLCHIIGITSFGKTCNGQVPGVYTRVSHYISWIESIVWP